MQLIILSIIVFLLSAILMFTNISKKFQLSILLVVILSTMTVYSEFTYQPNTTLSTKFNSSPTISTSFQFNLIPQPNNRFQLVYSYPQTGKTEYFKFLVHSQILNNQPAIYYNVQQPISSFKDALSFLFQHQTLQEIIDLIQYNRPLMVIDHLEKSIYENQCHLCDLLGILHQTSQNEIIMITNSIGQVLQAIDGKYLNQYLQLEQYNTVRYDWKDQAQSQKQSYEDYAKQQFEGQWNKDEKSKKIYKIAKQMICNDQEPCQNNFVNVGQLRRQKEFDRNTFNEMIKNNLLHYKDDQVKFFYIN